MVAAAGIEKNVSFQQIDTQWHATIGCWRRPLHSRQVARTTSINSTQVYADVVMETKIEAVNWITSFFEYGKN